MPLSVPVKTLLQNYLNPNTTIKKAQTVRNSLRLLQPLYLLKPQFITIFLLRKIYFASKIHLIELQLKAHSRCGFDVEQR